MSENLLLEFVVYIGDYIKKCVLNCANMGVDQKIK